MCENVTVRPVESVLRKGEKENKEERWWLESN
jgi:hypothetical protein